MLLVVAEWCLQHWQVASLVVLERCRSCPWVGAQILLDLQEQLELVALLAVVPRDWRCPLLEGFAGRGQLRVLLEVRDLCGPALFREHASRRAAHPLRLSCPRHTGWQILE